MEDYRLNIPEAPKEQQISQETQKTIQGSTEIKGQPNEFQEPFTSANYFNVPGWGQLLLDPRLDVHGLKDKVLFIDKFARDSILSRGLLDGKEGFEVVLKELEEMVHTGKDSRHEYRIRKIYDIARILSKHRSENVKKEKILDKILNMVRKKSY
jgi:hypothetical protein